MTDEHGAFGGLGRIINMLEGGPDATLQAEERREEFEPTEVPVLQNHKAQIIDLEDYIIDDPKGELLIWSHGHGCGIRTWR